jgi:hypothetical protein
MPDSERRKIQKKRKLNPKEIRDNNKCQSGN